MIVITERAQDHLTKQLLESSENYAALQILILKADSPNPECGIRLINPTLNPEQFQYDIKMGFKQFFLYIEKNSIRYLKNTFIDFKDDGLEGELYIETPELDREEQCNINNQFHPDWSLSEKIQFLLNTEISPGLAAHGGYVTLISVSEDNIVLLNFGGGCQGCGMANFTLKQGIEKRLKEQFPEIKEVRDITDHAAGENPYYTNEQQK